MSINVSARLRRSLLGLSVLISLMFTGLVFLLVYVIEDRVFVNQLRSEHSQFQALSATGDGQDMDVWQPNNRNIQRMDSLDSLAGQLPKATIDQVRGQLGIHEFFDGDTAIFIAHYSKPIPLSSNDTESMREEPSADREPSADIEPSADRELSADKEPSANNTSSYYLVYDVKNLLAVRDNKLSLLVLIAVTTLLITLFALWLANRLARTTMAPVTSLSRALKSDELDDVIIDMANQFSEDEFGDLARELARSLESIRASAKREYEFNRGVSHELRSPIQVAKSTVELLEANVIADLQTSPQPLSRLKRAVLEMEQIAESFLWLSSQRQLPLEEYCSAGDIRRVLLELQTRFKDHEIQLNASVNDAHLYPIPINPLSVLLRSLVQNVVNHGAERQLSINLTQDTIAVANALGDKQAPNAGFGLGLSIAIGLCKRFNCILDSTIEGNQFICSLVFAEQE